MVKSSQQRLQTSFGLLIGLLWLSPVLTQEPVRASKHMVVTANEYASAAGMRILRAGGTAVDAAVAVQLVLSLVEPQSSGVGGGAFMLYLDAADGPDDDSEMTAYQGRETAPAAATPDMFLDQDGNAQSFQAVGFGGLAVGVPGVMRMLELAHSEHGTLAWAELFVPAIELAERGFEISPRLYFLLDRFKRVARARRFKAHYYDDNGEAHAVGYRLVNDEYAASLRILAADGAEAMYSGELAVAIANRVQNNSLLEGRMTLDDLRGYSAEKLAPLCAPYRQWRICGPQLPSSGGVTLQQILGMLESFDLAAMQSDPADSIHLVAEASRLAFADRNFYLGDPDFVDSPVAELLSPDYLAGRAALIDPQRALEQVSPGTPRAAIAWNFAAGEINDRTSTSHFSIVDQWGNAVSMTSSVQGAFGSQLMAGGFILNNQLTDFSFEPERDGSPVANQAAAQKRPLSSMTPLIVLDSQGRASMLIGSPGGTRIIAYVAQATLGVLDWGLDIQQAVAAPHFLARTGALELERDTVLAEHAAALRELGHEVRSSTLNSGLHGITIEYRDDNRLLSGGVDPRREGVALGD